MQLYLFLHDSYVSNGSQITAFIKTLIAHYR